MNHQYFTADSKDISFIENESIHLIVTSPPYVTTEFKKGQDFDYDGFLSEFNTIAKELYRVVIPGGRFALNVADIVSKYRYTDSDSLLRLPFGSDMLQVVTNNGFRLVERFIWDKGFTRNMGGPLLGSYPYPMTIFNNNYFEYIWIFEKPGKRRTKQTIREKSRISLEDWRVYSQQWWRVESITEKFPYHRAIYPIEIPYRLIKMYSYCGDLVLDPFAGTAATGMAAFLLDRNSISVEIEKDCISMVEHRCLFEIKRGYDLSKFMNTLSFNANIKAKI